MKVDRFDIDVGIESVLIEENRAACTIGHVEPTCKNVMIDIFGRLLQGNYVPPACNLYFDGIFFPASGHRDPVVAVSLFCTIDRVAKCLLTLFFCMRRCNKSPY